MVRYTKDMSFAYKNTCMLFKSYKVGSFFLIFGRFILYSQVVRDVIYCFGKFITLKHHGHGISP